MNKGIDEAPEKQKNKGEKQQKRTTSHIPLRTTTGQSLNHHQDTLKNPQRDPSQLRKEATTQRGRKASNPKQRRRPPLPAKTLTHGAPRIYIAVATPPSLPEAAKEPWLANPSREMTDSQNDEGKKTRGSCEHFALSSPLS